MGYVLLLLQYEGQNKPYFNKMGQATHDLFLYTRLFSIQDHYIWKHSEKKKTENDKIHNNLSIDKN